MSTAAAAGWLVLGESHLYFPAPALGRMNFSLISRIGMVLNEWSRRKGSGEEASLKGVMKIEPFERGTDLL